MLSCDEKTTLNLYWLSVSSIMVHTFGALLLSQSYGFLFNSANYSSYYFVKIFLNKSAFLKFFEFAMIE